MNPHKTEKLIAIIFAIVGIVLIMVSLGLYMLTTYKNNEATKAVITKIETYGRGDDQSHIVTVTYQVDGKTYETNLNSWSSDWYESKEIEVYYDVNNPYKVQAKEMMYLGPLITGILGTEFTLFSVAYLIFTSNKRNIKLKENGMLVNAKYIKTEINNNYSVNGANPYNVYCSAINPETGEECVYKSKNIWENPETIINEKNITSIPVYVDSKKKNKYYVDIDSVINN